MVLHIFYMCICCVEYHYTSLLAFVRMTLGILLRYTVITLMQLRSILGEDPVKRHGAFDSLRQSGSGYLCEAAGIQDHHERGHVVFRTENWSQDHSWDMKG